MRRGGKEEPFQARNLLQGLFVLFSSGEGRIRKVDRFRALVEVIKLTFNPDVPIEVFSSEQGDTLLDTLATYGDKHGPQRRVRVIGFVK